MAKGKRQHLVPQQMIRRFANDDGYLFEMLKPKLEIATRKKRPKGIVFRDDYYVDSVSDFDEDLLQRVEQKFALHYPKLVDGPWEGRTWPGDVGAAFVDWVAAMLCRTPLLVAMARAIAARDDPVMKIAIAAAPKMMDNIFRSGWYEEQQDLLSRPGWRWKCLNITVEKNIVITDNPVCHSANIGGKHVVLVPLSKRRILFGGSADAVEGWRGVPVDLINLVLAAWAERQIFAADRETLETLLRNLRGEGEFGPREYCEAARKPLFGLPERSSSTPIPEGVDTSKFWEDLKGSYGQTILPWKK